ncbi:uncharacterized protein LOC128330458 [Hemicordylus capensis]|uniref:uncharacterized protein LOC128330458 n=1 Tax=Hemicordylus capensis TaxID=884348 RepID=UPI0023046943|nr:uncharacterized protein LOC128330458 [Hemicordylus capensis]XP_053119376.1 uncharacterized protein LOC128330458 [Hemicordylus capensis]XP_053119377.1 uncharacterized protein LOC128330458 [Hemicordylus capensis]
MENPLESTGSKTQGLDNQAVDNTLQNLNNQAGDDKFHDEKEQTGKSKSQDLYEQAEDSIPQDLNEQAEDSIPQDLNEQAEDSIPQDLNEQAEDSIPQDLNEQAEYSIPQDLNEQAEDSLPQDLNEQAEEQIATVVEVPEQQLQDEEPFLPSHKVSMTDPEDESYSSTAPEQTSDDNTFLRETDDSEPENLKKQTDEGMETLVKMPEQRPWYQTEMESPLTVYVSSQKISKKQKAEAPVRRKCSACGHICSFPRPMSAQSQLMPPKIPPPRRFIPQKPKPETADKATQLRAIPIFPLRLPGSTRAPPQRSHTPKPLAKSPTTESATQISPSFERLMKKPPPSLAKLKKSRNKITKSSSGKTISSSLQRESVCQHGSTVQRAPLRKRGSAKRTLRQLKKQDTGKQAPLALKKQMRPQVTYNLYVNICDSCNEVDPCCFQRNHWEEEESPSGLSRACTVFSILRYGGIHINDLLLALHTLGILVTHDEMHQALKHVKVDARGILDFSEFLEVVNQTSPFAQTEALQRTLWAFRKIKSGLVAIRELDPVLMNLGVSLSDENVQPLLKSTRINRNGKVDLSAFLLAARELQRSHEEEEGSQNEFTILERKPFKDVANFPSVQSRWRRKYQDFFDEEMDTPPEMDTPTCLFPLKIWSGSDDDIAVTTQSRRASLSPSPVSPEYTWELEDKDPALPDYYKWEPEDLDREIKEITKPLSDGTGQKRLSFAASVHDVEEEDKDRSIMEVTSDPADERRPSTASLLYNDRDVAEVTKS